MRELILEKLKEIEEREDVRVLHAVECGSRAWGFSSAGSDYDVRFLYVHRPEFYLKLEKTRDVIELPVHERLDINGWDLNKALRLLHSANPGFFEWMASPQVYRQTEFSRRILPVMEQYFSCKSSLYHYLSMAEGNYRDHGKGELVRPKKYLHVLRSVLACKWILNRGTRPPVDFETLAEEELAESLKPEVARILNLKRNAPEIQEIPRVEPIHAYLDEHITALREEIRVFSQEEPEPGWEPLNALFLWTLGVGELE